MNLPPHVSFAEDLSLMIWRPRGVIDEDAVEAIMKSIDEYETTLEKPFNRLTDTLSADMVDLNFEYIFRVSLYRRLAYTGPPVKSAVLANSPQVAQYWKLHAMLTQGSPLEVKIFKERAHAAAWLEVPKERLS